MAGRDELERLERFLGRSAPDRRRTRAQAGSAGTDARVRFAARLTQWSGRENPFAILRQLEHLRESRLRRPTDAAPA